MNNIFVTGIGAVSPAGWGVATLRDALLRGLPLPETELPRPGTAPLRVRRVPPPQPRPKFLADSRLRRASPISHFAVAAALEALGKFEPDPPPSPGKLGIIFCVMTGCVNYSRRFYDEVLKDPATASPLVFPETVLNAPASHLAALLQTNEISYTLVGDPSVFAQALATAAEWLLEDRVRQCLVLAAEEIDWLVTEGLLLFQPAAVVSEGAGALCLETEPRCNPAVKLAQISSPHLFFHAHARLEAARRARAELGKNPPRTLLSDGLQGLPGLDADEASAWSDWDGSRVSPKRVLGEALAAGSAWQCVAAVDALRREAYPAANVSILGLNQQAITVQFTRA